MNQAQQGMTGTGSPPSTTVAVGSGAQSLAQLTDSEGKTVVGNGPVTIGTMTGSLVEIVVVGVPLGSGSTIALLHGHGGGRIVRGTGVDATSGMVVGVMTKGGGLILAVGMMMDGTPPPSVVVRTTSEKLMMSVVTSGMEISVVTVIAV